MATRQIWLSFATLKREIQYFLLVSISKICSQLVANLFDVRNLRAPIAWVHFTIEKWTAPIWPYIFGLRKPYAAILRVHFAIQYWTASIWPKMSGLRNLYAAIVKVHFTIENWTHFTLTIHIWFTESVCCNFRSPIFDWELDPYHLTILIWLTK